MDIPADIEAHLADTEVIQASPKVIQAGPEINQLGLEVNQLGLEVNNNSQMENGIQATVFHRLTPLSKLSTNSSKLNRNNNYLKLNEFSLFQMLLITLVKETHSTSLLHKTLSVRSHQVNSHHTQIATSTDHHLMTTASTSDKYN